MGDLIEGRDLGFPAIIDLTGYTEKMRKSFLDKTFFLEKIDANVFLDYGCADGSMIEFVHKMFPEYHYIGFDPESTMIALANKKNIPNAVFFDNGQALYEYLLKLLYKNRLKDNSKRLAVIFSSVIHEALAYNQIHNFQSYFERLRPMLSYVCVRDMAVPAAAINEPVSIDDVWKLAYYYLNNRDDAYILTDFQKKWGQIKNKKQLAHFLLKYRYKNNWERELNENYVGWTYESYCEYFGKFGSIVYQNNFILPFLKKNVKENFNIDLDTPTHIKLIVKTGN